MPAAVVVPVVMLMTAPGAGFGEDDSDGFGEGLAEAAGQGAALDALKLDFNEAFGGGAAKGATGAAPEVVADAFG